MDFHDDVLKVYWPFPCPGFDTDGFIVGWWREKTVVVAGIVSTVGKSEFFSAELNGALVKLATDRRYSSLNSYTDGSLEIVGEWFTSEANADQKALADTKDNSNRSQSNWLYMTSCNNHSVSLPTLIKGSSRSSSKEENESFVMVRKFLLGGTSSGSSGSNFTESLYSGSNVYVIYYRPPNSSAGEFYSARVPAGPSLNALGATALALKLNANTSIGSAFDITLAQINASTFAYLCIERCYSRSRGVSQGASSLLGLNSPPGASNIGTFPQSKKYIRFLLSPLVYLLTFCRILAGILLYLLQAQVPSFVPLFGGLSFYSVSKFTRQVHLKLREYSRWPLLFHRYRKLQDDIRTTYRWHPPASISTASAQLYDSTTRNLLDVALGLTASVLLLSGPTFVNILLRQLHSVGSILHIKVLSSYITAMMGFPAGFKLNHFLGQKLGNVVLASLHLWELVTTFLTPFEPRIVASCGFLGPFGLSLVLSAAADLLAAFTPHLLFFYRQFARLHNSQLHLFVSLWRLFMGKKRNVLRSRVDSNDFNVAQLLLGTMLFTVVFFLFPTFVLYYGFFSGVWLMVSSVRLLLWVLLTLLNNVPIFSAFKRLFYPFRVPGSVTVQVIRWDVTIHERVLPASTFLDIPLGQFDVVSPAVAQPSGEAEEIGNELQATRAPSHIWCVLKSQVAPVSFVLSPLSSAFSLFMQQYSAGDILSTIFLGSPLKMKRPIITHGPVTSASTATPTPASTTITTSSPNFAAVQQQNVKEQSQSRVLRGVSAILKSALAPLPHLVARSRAPSGVDGAALHPLASSFVSRDSTHSHTGSGSINVPLTAGTNKEPIRAGSWNEFHLVVSEMFDRLVGV